MKKPKITCDICGSSDCVYYGKMLIKCKQCQLVRANEIYSSDKLVSLYQHDYYFGNEYNNYINDRPALEKNFIERINYLKKKKYLHKESSVVEIGSAYGFFLNLMKDECRSIMGYDVTKEGVKYAKKKFKVNAICGDFLKYTGEKVSLICMWDVVEHLSSPREFIKKISYSLTKNGKLILTTGDVGSFLAKVQGSSWRMIHPPTHLFYFDKITIEKLLNRYDLQIIDIRYKPVYRNLGSVVKQVFKLKPNKLISDINLDKYNFGLNLFDIMEVTAVKTN